ncbi:MAG TPA: tetratricopeptide repeat protein [Terriglobia bacterium]|nr:tetratricopeptide repeat protein [Terriglobia bacterium]
MFPNPLAGLQQQYQQACALAQQAMMMEAAANPAAAAQLYDQAIWLISSCIMQAQQSGIPTPDPVFFSLCFCNFNAARMKWALGAAQFVPAHLAQALGAINQAITLNPGFSSYHTAAGMVLMAQGSLAWAEQAFQRALQLNPMDVQAQWLLGSLYNMQGNAATAQQYYAAVQRQAPNVQVPQFGPPQVAPGAVPSGTAGSGHTLDTVEKVLNIAKTGLDVLGGFQKLFGSGTGGFSAGGFNSGW